MAYTNDYMDYGVGAETEEERRRREEEERRRALEASGQSSFGDIAGQYLDKRLGQAEQRLSDIGQVFTDPGAALEQRLGTAPKQDLANTEVQTQTIKTYGDGSQEEITKKQIPAEQTGPAIPQVQAPVAQTAPVAPVAQAAPVAQTAAPQMTMEERVAAAAQRAQERAAASSMQQPQQQPDQFAQAAATPVAPVQLPQAGPGVQVAAAPGAQMPQTQAPVVQQVAATPGASLAQIAQSMTATPEDRQQQEVIAAHNETDPAKRRQMFAQLLSNPETTEGNKNLANKFIAEDYLKERNLREAEKKIAAASPTELARYMKEQNKEGSYVKAILFARLGLNELAKREQELISPDLKMDSASDSEGNKFTVVRNAQGAITKAFDTSGKEASQEQVAKLSAAALPTKAHLLPSVHGTPVVKEVDGQQIGGLRMYDPQTQSSYVQVGNRRLPDTGWITPGQAPGAVYTAAGAKAQGTAAGEGFTPTPLPARPGTTPAVDETRKALERAQGDIAGADRQIAELSRLPNTDPTKQQRIAIIQAEKNQAQQQVQRLSGAIQGLTPGGGTVGAPVGGTVAEQKKNLAIAEARAKEELQVAGKRSEGFNKHIDETITPDAINGDSIASTRKQQFALFDRPGVDAGKIFGIANGAGSAPGDQRWTMFRDVLLGKVSEPEDKIRERAAALGLNPAEQSAAVEYAIMNADINSKTLKSTSGAGPVSDAEQQINKERNVDITKVPMLGGYNAMAQSQFAGDLAKYKGDWSTTSTATNTAQLEKDWRREKAKVTELYTDMAKKRIDYISSMGNTAAAIKEGYRRFPVPQYDPITGEWIKKKPLSSYER